MLPNQETTTDHEVQKLTSHKLTAENHLVTEDGKTGIDIDEEGFIKVTLDNANWHYTESDIHNSNVELEFYSYNSTKSHL